MVFQGQLSSGGDEEASMYFFLEKRPRRLVSEENAPAYTI